MKELRCIDFHAHCVTDVFRTAMDDLGINVMEEDGFPLPAWTAEDHLRFMDEVGIDLTVLSAPVPHIHNGDDRLARIAAGKINEDIAEIVRAYPDRFRFVGLAPLPDVEGSIAETAHAMDELGAAGMKVATNMNGVYLGDRRFDPLMEEWNQRKAMVIIHPCRARQRPKEPITGTVAAIYEWSFSEIKSPSSTGGQLKTLVKGRENLLC